MELVHHLMRQCAFSEKTFGSGVRTQAICDHIRKELLEIEQSPHDLMEWIDIVILGFDGAWRAGYTPEEINKALIEKQTINESRKWPDWRTVPEGQSIEHVKEI